jgi:pimeloyl-ACP methyl ester carboxylesterase
MAGLARRGVRTVAFDQRGYSAGARPSAVDHYRIEVLAADVLEFAAALGETDFHLVAHDWGAAVAWYLAATKPKSIQTLTAVSQPHLAAYGRALRNDADQRKRSAYVRLLRSPDAESTLLADNAQWLRSAYGDGIPSETVESYLVSLRQPGALAAALRWYRAMEPSLADLPPVEVATTFVWGNQDWAIGRAAARGCAEFVHADFSYLELPGVGHWIPEMTPASLTRAILARLGG